MKENEYGALIYLLIVGVLLLMGTAGLWAE